MIKRIFKSTFGVSMITLLIAYAIIVGILYDYFGDQIEREMKAEAAYIACGMEVVGAEYLEGFRNNGYVNNDGVETHKSRITWILEDGEVLYDSNVDEGTMENHLNRQEVQEALHHGEGYEVRYSDTLREQTVYYAVQLKDGSILRLSSAYKTVFSILISMLQPTIILVVVIVVLSYCLSKSMAKSIVEPINTLDLMNGEMEEEYEELVPLLKRIRKQNVLIEHQMDDLKTQQAKFQTLTEHMREGFLVLDKKENILSYNVAAVELLGAPRDMDYTGENVIVFDRDRELREAVKEAVSGKRGQRILDNGERIYRIVANPIVVNDEIKDETKVRFAPTNDQVPEEQVEGVIVIILDETEKEKRDQLRREFTSNVSHELKTPLTSISGIAEIIMNGIVKPEDISGFAKNIYEEAGRLIGLVNDIIFLSKLDEETVSYVVEDMNLLAMTKQVKERLQIPSKEKNVSIHIVGEDVIMKGIPSMMEEVIYNLCDNGIKYNKQDGRVAVTLHTFEDMGVNKVSIKVEDTGIGIPLEDQERVFERFYRVDKSHSRAIGGTGLGLSIVKHVVMFHHGDIQMESTLGVGTAITVTLPLDFSVNSEI